MSWFLRKIFTAHQPPPSPSKSSSVDDSEAGQQNTGHLMMMSQDSDQSKMNKVDDETKQQWQNSERQPVKVREDNDQPTSSNQDGAEAPPEQMQVDMNQENQQMVPNNQQMVPNNQPMVPNNQQMVPNNQQMVPNNQQMVPNNQPMVPNNQQIDPNNQQMVLRELKNELSEFQMSSLDEELLGDSIKKTSNDPMNLLKLFKLLNEQQKKSSKASSSWFKATVKVFSVVTGETCGADRVILKKMKKSVTVELTTHGQECDIIIVFCPIISRVGSDVNTAMRKITDNKPVILVLMHHTRDVDYSTDIKKWSEALEEVVLDVHVFFHETLQGLLKCRRNDQAVNQIQEVLKRHSKYGLSRS